MHGCPSHPSRTETQSIFMWVTENMYCYSKQSALWFKFCVDYFKRVYMSVRLGIPCSLSAILATSPQQVFCQ